MSSISDDDIVKHTARNLRDVATDLIDRVRDYNYTDFDVRKAAFAAFEANRDNPRATLKRRDVIFFVIFLAVTILSPVLVVWWSPYGDQSFMWDMFGVVSTLVLLGWTFGWYTVAMASDFFSDILRFFKGLLFIGADPTTKTPSEIEAALNRKETRTATRNIFLLALAIAATGGAIRELMQLYDLSAPGLRVLAAYNWAYVWFFFWIFCLSIIFIAMDINVAMTDHSHSETFIASSSIVYATVPMFIGILIMALYMGMEYAQAIARGLGSDAAIKSVPVGFVSGALSFQMIISNVLFIFIKLNLFLGAAYQTIDTSDEK